MIAGLKPYPRYKDSGVEWLEQVPEGWEVRRLRTVAELRVSNVDKHVDPSEQPARLCNYVDVYKNDRIGADLDFMRGSVGPREFERFRLRIGDVLITKDSESWDDIGHPALVEYEAPDLVCGYHLAILRPRSGILAGPYLLRALQSGAVSSRLHVAANGVTRFGLTQGAINALELPLPPLADQWAAARVLDRIDVRINHLVSAKQRLIERLEEEKQAVIHRAVTRGLDPSVRLKPSGLDWLEDVPEHWEVVRLRATVDALIGGVWGADPTGESDLVCVRVADFDRDMLTVRATASTMRSITPGERAHRVLQRGDLLLEKSGGGKRQPAGAVVRFDQDLPAVCSNFIARLSTRSDYDSEFLAYLHAALYSVRINVRSIKQTTGIQNLSVSSYLAEKVALPDRAEQQLIAEYLNERLERLRAVQDESRRQIDLLGELRTRLISNVVTGKLDVREAAARLPTDPGETDEALEEAIEGAVA